MAGNKRITNGEIAQGKLRGKAMADALARAMQNNQDAGAKGVKKNDKRKK